MGKHKPTYLPHIDSGDYVVVSNARKAVLTGRKMQRKLYRWHTGYPGGLREQTPAQISAKKPEEILRRAVHGMLPRNRLKKLRARKLRIFADEPDPAILRYTETANAPETPASVLGGRANNR